MAKKSVERRWYWYLGLIMVVGWILQLPLIAGVGLPTTGGLPAVIAFIVEYIVGFITWPATLSLKIAKDPAAGIGYTLGVFGFLAIGIWLIRKRPKSRKDDDSEKRNV